MRLRAVPLSFSLSYKDLTPNQPTTRTSFAKALQVSRQRRFFTCLALGRKRRRNPRAATGQRPSV